MRKYLFSNWINLLLTVLGFYAYLLITAIMSLRGDDRGLTFETVFVETLGGSIAYTFSYIVSVEQMTFLGYVVFLVCTSAIVFTAMKKTALSKAIFVESIVISIAMLFYLLSVKNYEMLYLIGLLWLSQFFRYRKLFKKYGRYLQ